MNVGEVEIKLNGEVKTLRPSLGAAKRVNARGGFASVVGRLQAADFDFYVLVVAAGLGKKEAEIENAVYLTGLPALGADLVTFVNILANGGKPFGAEAPEGDGSGEA